MSAHALYVASAYGISALTLVVLALWILTDQRTRQRELAALEEAGIRRRSDAQNLISTPNTSAKGASG